MTVIKQADLIKSIADALQNVSYYHPPDFIGAVNPADQRELNPAPRMPMAKMEVAREPAKGPSSSISCAALVNRL